jgi:capsid assembly protease
VRLRMMGATMLRSHLLDAFLASAWHLHGQVYDRLSDLLEAHVLGRKAELRGRDLVPLDFLDDGAQDAAPVDETAGDYLDQGIAVIDIRGVLAMHADQVNGDCQPQGRSYESIIAQLALAVADPKVRAIVVRAETPGGSACGCQEAYDAVVAADLVKPTYGYIAGYCFSAGTYVLSGCRSITASSTAAHTGSIGTVMALWDTSEAAAEAGYKRVVIRSGAYKAIYQPGEKLTDAARAELQRECDAYAAAFYDAVRAGRGLTDAQAEQVLNGRTFLAAEAQHLGLIDAIQPFATFIAGIAGTQEPAVFGLKKTPATTATEKPAETKATEKPVETKPAAGLTKDQYAALATEFPGALDRLKALDADGASADEILATLLREQVGALTTQLTAANATKAEAAKAHGEAVAAKDKTIGELQAKVAKTQSWTGTVAAVEDPGSKASADTPRSAAAIKAAWDADANLRDNFALGGIASYVEHLRLTGQLTAGEAKDITVALK